ncbi:CocE/NonD family hydrolase [Nocardioides sp. NPDC101246]|uniref:CocE/NonD family hydrolase n=1 Tax=Nocardioides sp. NPDC101246 TaxID=3364336 RepID=UPI00382B6ABA
MRQYEPTARTPRRLAITVIASLLVAALLAAPEAASASAETGPRASVVSDDAPYGIERHGNVELTMRDGTVLRANVYYPTEPETGDAAEGPFPVLLTSTPYGKDQGDSDPTKGQGLMGKADYLIARGYIHVVLDVRGTGASEGDWSFNQPIEAQDGVEVVDWAAELPHSNGKVGLVGQSYAGINQFSLAAAVGPDSPLKAILPGVPADDLYRDAMTLGGVPDPFLPISYNAANVPQIYLNALTSLASPGATNASVEDLLEVLVDHTGAVGMLPVTDMTLGGPKAFDSAYWAERRPHSKLQEVVDNDIPALVLGGWKDAFQRGGPLLYAGLQNAAAGRSVDGPMTRTQPISPKYQLIEGPWYHASIGLEPIEPRLDIQRVALRWFDHWLKGKQNGVGRTQNPLRSYDLTSHEWTETSTYPFPGTTYEKFYLDAGPTGTIASSNDGALTRAKPTAEGSDRIVWSNAPGCTPSISQFMLIGNDVQESAKLGLAENPCNLDSRPVQVGPAAATYTTEPFTESRTLAGPIAARIFASATTTDSQWVVRVDDVAPDGTSRPLSRGGLLGSHRRLDAERTWTAADGSPTLPYHPHDSISSTPVLPGALTRYDVEVFGVQATIAAGHRIRVTVSSGDSPAVLPTLLQTLQLAGGVYDIQRGAAAASYVQLPFTSGQVAPCADQLMCPGGKD